MGHPGQGPGIVFSHGLAALLGDLGILQGSTEILNKLRMALSRPEDDLIPVLRSAFAALMLHRPSLRHDHLAGRDQTGLHAHEQPGAHPPLAREEVLPITLGLLRFDGSRHHHLTRRTTGRRLDDGFPRLRIGLAHGPDLRRHLRLRLALAALVLNLARRSRDTDHLHLAEGAGRLELLRQPYRHDLR